VDQLREKWQELMDLAEQVREVLLKERRGAFEQELDKQVKVLLLYISVYYEVPLMFMIMFFICFTFP